MTSVLGLLLGGQQLADICIGADGTIDGQSPRVSHQTVARYMAPRRPNSSTSTVFSYATGGVHAAARWTSAESLDITGWRCIPLAYAPDVRWLSLSFGSSSNRTMLETVVQIASGAGARPRQSAPNQRISASRRAPARGGAPGTRASKDTTLLPARTPGCRR